MPTPKNVKAILECNSLAVFQRCFIKNYVTIIEPITRLTSTNEPLIR